MTVGDETREEIEEALGHAARTAARIPAVVGNSKWETPWDRAHKRVDDLLNALDRLED